MVCYDWSRSGDGLSTIQRIKYLLFLFLFDKFLVAEHQMLKNLPKTIFQKSFVQIREVCRPQEEEIKIQTRINIVRKQSQFTTAFEKFKSCWC